MIAILIVVRLFAATPMGRAYVEARIESLSARGQQVEIDGLHGDLLGRFRVDRVQISDSEGIWLTGENIEIEWTPLSLASGHLKIRDIELANVSVVRRPLLVSSRAASGNGALLSAYTIKRASIDQISLADGVAGPQSTYHADGHFLYRPGSGAAALALRPIQSGLDRINADLTWGGSVPLLGTLQVDGQPGGLLATLAGVRAGDGVAATLDASYQDEHWSVDADAKIGGAAVFEFSVLPDGDAISVAGKVDGSLSTFTSGFAKRLGGPVNVKGTIGPRSERTPVALVLAAPNLEVEAQGMYYSGDGAQALEAMTADITLIDAARVTGHSDLNMDLLRLNGTLSRSADSLQYQGKFVLPHFGWARLNGRELEFDGMLAYTDSKLQVDIGVAAGSLSGISPRVDDLLSSPILGSLVGEYEIPNRRITLEQLSIHAKGATLSSTGTIELDGRSDFRGALLIARAAGLPLTGAAQWVLQGNDSVFRGTLSGQARLLHSDANIQPLIGDELTFVTKVERDTSGALELDGIRISGGVLTAEGAARLADGRLSLDGSAHTQPVDISGTGLGPATLGFSMSGPIADLSGDLTLQLDWLDRAGHRFEDVELVTRVTSLDGVSGVLDLSAQYQDEVLSAAADVTLSEGQWQVSSLHAKYAALQLTGNASGRGGDLQSLTSNLDLSGTLLNNRAFSGTLAYDEATLNAEFQASDLQFDAVSLDYARLTLLGVWPQFSADLEADGGIEIGGVKSALSLSPSLQVDLFDRTLVADILARIGTVQIKTPRSATASFGDTLAFDVALNGFGGEAVLVGDLAETGRMDLKLVGIDLSKIGPVFGRASLRGDAVGSVNLRSSEDKIEGVARLDVVGLSRGATNAVRANLGLDAELVGEVLSLNATAGNSDGDLKLAALAVLPMQTSYSQRLIGLRPGADAKVEIVGGGEIAPLWSLAAQPDLRMEGKLQVDLGATGPLDGLRPTGPVSIRQGIFEDGETGVLLKGVSMDAELVPDAIEVASLSANGGRSGILTGSGRYAYDGSGRVNINLDRLDAFYRRDLSAIVSGDIAVGRSLKRTDITGRLRLNEARLDLSNLPRAGYTTLEVQFDDEPAIDLQKETPSPVQLDLSVNANRRVFVTGAGVDSEWSIDATVKGSPGAPILGGQATIVRGEADLISQRFLIEDGNVRFDGALEDSLVQFKAVRSSDDIVAAVNVSGRLMEPDISLTSDPDLPEDEIVSRVLFGRSPAGLSPIQAAQLAAAAAQLAGGSGVDLTAPLQSAIGLDRLDIGVDAEGGATLSTGKYLTRDVYLEVETGATGAPGIAVEWTPLRNVEIDANIDPELGPSVAIQWRRDFDSFRGEEAAPD